MERDSPAPHGETGSIACAVCRRATADVGSFMRLHLEAGRLELCSPRCAGEFRAAPQPGTPRIDGFACWQVRWGP